MKQKNIPLIRLTNQLILSHNINNVKKVVAWMGAMQAQDFKMAKWAIGLRLQKVNEHTVEDAINKGEIIRTHLLRPTWHFVSSEDIFWMLKLTAPQIKSSLKSRHRQLNIDESEIRKCNRILENELRDEKHLTRDQLISRLKQSKIEIKNNRASHIFLLAELEGLICSGSSKNGKQTYALLEERVKNKIIISKEEALSKLALKYFTSHSPATLQDFIWWSGLPAKDAKSALDMVQSNFISEEINGNKYLINKLYSLSSNNRNSIHMLPAYDEFIISYKDRSASIRMESIRKVISSNGLFRPSIEINGEITGIWKPIRKSNNVVIEIYHFQKQKKIIKNIIEKVALEYGNFLQKKIELIMN